MANNSSRKKTYQTRDPRIDARSEDRNYVGFGNAERGLRAAQFRDVSKSGMKLISRLPLNSVVGDVVDVEFSLPGSKTELRSRALITRRINEFEFAVAFMDFATMRKDVIGRAVSDYVRYLRASPVIKAMTQVREWVDDNRRGLIIAFLGLVIFAAAFGWIYATSDEANGREIRSWGTKYPRKYDWDYYNKIPKN